MSAKGCAHGCIDETGERGARYGAVQACQDRGGDGARHVRLHTGLGNRGVCHRQETDGGQLRGVQHRKGASGWRGEGGVCGMLQPCIHHARGQAEGGTEKELLKRGFQVFRFQLSENAYSVIQLFS